MVALVFRMAILTTLAAAAGLILNGLRPDGVSFTAPLAAGACKVQNLAEPVERLSAAQANALCGAPGVLVADARPAAMFAAGHVAGAVHLPCAAPGDVATSVPRLLAGHHTVVVYGEGTADALAVADGLLRRHDDGRLKVAVIEGGFAAWDRAGLACASGPCPECADDLHEHEAPEATR